MKSRKASRSSATRPSAPRSTGAQSVARQHAEWLSLIEVSGPFLSIPVLCETFPDGLDRRQDGPDLRKNLRVAYEEWLDDQAGKSPDLAIHHAWVRYLLREVLGFDAELLVQGQALPAALRARVDEHGETLEPTFAVLQPAGRPDAGRGRLLVTVLPKSQSLRSSLPSSRWKASPDTRMMTLLHRTGVRLGLVTNGDELMLVHAKPNETTTFASFYTNLLLDEPLTLQAFASLLSAERLFAVPDPETLESLFDRSADAQQEITDQLGYQVRRAVEVLVQNIDRIDRDRGRKLLADYDVKQLYEVAVTVMMRLVFLLAAEERGLFLRGDALYDESYAITTLRDQLQETADQHGKEVLRHRYDAFARLLATFRAVYGGVRHDRLRLPAYGGSLFDPDRYPFLEGRAKGSNHRETPADPLPIDNLTVLDLLSALQILEVQIKGRPAEARRLSFRALGVEQIGHVYEGLLDHTAMRARSPVVSLRSGKHLEPEIEIDELERLKKKGTPALIDYLQKRTARSSSALEKDIDYPLPKEDARRLLIACDNAQPLYRKVEPWAGIVRKNVHGMPVVYGEGAVYVTQGDDRRTTGTHYTPPSLTEPIVRHTLEPLVYEGPAEGWPKEKWRLRSAETLLGLKVCDLAMGSGAFLVQTCRYLAERLVESWERAESQSGGRMVISPDGRLSTGSATERPIPKDPAERIAIALRAVADRCLYGVDKNPMAVEMAKLSLWLVTLQKDRPFTFVDHALRAGDSLLGITSLEQIRAFHIDPKRGRALHKSQTLFDPQRVTKDAIHRATLLRQKIGSFSVETLTDAHNKGLWLAEADRATDDLRLLGDLIIGAALSTASRGAAALDRVLVELAPEVQAALDAKAPRAAREERLAALRQRANEMLQEHRQASQAERSTFHWAVELPEVIREGGGFDAFVCNPPFQGGQRITGALGTDYRDLLVEHLAGGARGSADLSAYFLLRASSLLSARGGLGTLATNTIAQGDTREVGLDRLVAEGFVIPRAIPSRPWPGVANLEIAQLWVRRGDWKGESVLDDKPVAKISPYLTKPGAVSGKPYRLAANAGKSFQGSIVLGMGFVLEPAAAQALIDKDKRNKDVLFPYLNGQDLNSSPDQSPSRWVINFFDWPLDRKSAPAGYAGPVAADYPDCLAIVREKVKPERDTNKRKVRRERWWQYAERAPALYAAIEGMERVLVCSEVTKHLSFCFVRNRWVYSANTDVFTCTHADFAALQSSLHDAWARLYSSQLETRLKYSPGNAFETFPLPPSPLAADPGLAYHDRRQEFMASLQEGLTMAYNRFHERLDNAGAVIELRKLHVEMDKIVAGAYGWTDLDLDHDFHETPQGTRFTISEPARREVLDRLLALNHERYAEEVRQGLHDKKGAKPARAAPPKPAALGKLDGAPPASQRHPAPPEQLDLFGTSSAPAEAGAPASSREPKRARSAERLSAPARALLRVLKERHTPMAKPELCEAAGIGESAWREAIRELKAAKLIAQDGANLAAQYRQATALPISVGGDSVETD